MTERSTVHASFTIERVYPYPRPQVFRAFADPAAKSAWFDEPGQGSVTERFEFDFRVGGRERSAAHVTGGPAIGYEARYEDIVENERIVTTYFMTVGHEKISASIASTEFIADSGGTRLIVTEQGVFLDGLDNNAQRQQGVAELLDALGRVLAGGPGHA
jgi:uncharacterized protein YndB with AHSA1/START domain